MAQKVKCLPAMWETQVRSLGQEGPLEKEMVTQSSTLAWKIPQRSLVGYSPWGHKELDMTERPHFLYVTIHLSLVYQFMCEVNHSNHYQLLCKTEAVCKQHVQLPTFVGSGLFSFH